MVEPSILDEKEDVRRQVLIAWLLGGFAFLTSSLPSLAQAQNVELKILLSLRHCNFSSLRLTPLTRSTSLVTSRQPPAATGA
jgi:hypothetical protein